MTRSRVGGRDSWITVILIDCACCGFVVRNMDIVCALADYNQQSRPRVSLVTWCSRTATRSAVSSSAGTSELLKKTIATIVVFVGAYHIVCIDTIVSEFDDFDQRDQKFTVHRVFSVDQIGVFALKILLRYTRNNCHKFYLWFHSSVSSLAKTQRVNLSAHIILSIFPKEASQSAVIVDHKTIGHFACARYIPCFSFSISIVLQHTLST